MNHLLRARLLEERAIAKLKGYRWRKRPKPGEWARILAELRSARQLLARYQTT